MQGTLKWMVLISVLLLPLMLAASAQEAPLAEGEIWGRVIDPETGKPLTGITVSVDDHNVGAISGAEGDFSLGQLPLQPMTVVFAHPCFHPVSVEVELASDLPRRRVSVGIPYDYETEARTGCDWRMKEDSSAGS